MTHRKQHIMAAGVATFIVIADLATKAWALRALADGRQLEWLGGWVPLTLAFNRGAAFGLTIGDDPRWIFIPVTVVAVIFLFVLIAQARRGDEMRTLASALVMGGALGNLYDRVRWDRGVVDFIGPIDLGFMHWPIFNVADMAITVGAILLAIAFWREERRPQPESEGSTAAPSRQSSEDPRPDPTTG